MTAQFDDTFRLVGRVVGGRYAVGNLVARGGFGLVYKATHIELSAPVALKVLVVPEHLRGNANASFVERFRQEARTLAALKHPAIVRVIDVGSLDVESREPGDDPCVWMALEWLDGVTLEDDLCVRGGRGRSPREALSLLNPAFEAIASAHDHGIAHRDLKPANLMISPPARGEIEMRVLDFGIAKTMLPDERPGSGQTDTHGDFNAFSLQHAAPEQVVRARTGPWTDVHALGLLVTEVLVGRRALQGADSFALYGAVMSPERPTPARHGLGVGPWEPVLARAMALHPAERFDGAGALLAALSACVDDAQRAWERPRLSDTAPDPSAVSPRRARRYAPGVAAVLLASALLATRLGPTPAPARSPPPVVTPPVVTPSVVTPPAVAPPAVAPPAVAPFVAAPVVDAAVPAARAVPLRRIVHRDRGPPARPTLVGDSDPEVMIE